MLVAPVATYTNSQYELNIPERKIDETEKNNGERMHHNTSSHKLRLITKILNHDSFINSLIIIGSERI